MNQIAPAQRELLKIIDCAIHAGACSDQPADWGNVLSEAKLQAVYSLIYPTVKDFLPGELRERAEILYSQYLVRNVCVDQEHSELHQLLSANNIPYVILKGAASAAYYPEPLLRAMGDVDFLIHRKDIDRTDILLKNNGFVRETAGKAVEGYHHFGYHRAGAGAPSVWELHWDTNGIPEGTAGRRLRAYLDDIIETETYINTEEAACFVPDEFHHGLVLLVHTATHFVSSGIGLRHLCDWALFADRMDSESFIKIFRKPLEDCGMWRFAQLLTQLSVT